MGELKKMYNQNVPKLLLNFKNKGISFCILILVRIIV